MKLKYQFVINNVAGETVAVSVGDTSGRFNGYIKLNETGAFIFKKLKYYYINYVKGETHDTSNEQ